MYHYTVSPSFSQEFEKKNGVKSGVPAETETPFFISFTILSIAYAIQFLLIHTVVRSLFCDVDIMRMALF